MNYIWALVVVHGYQLSPGKAPVLGAVVIEELQSEKECKKRLAMREGPPHLGLACVKINPIIVTSEPPKER